MAAKGSKKNGKPVKTPSSPARLIRVKGLPVTKVEDATPSIYTNYVQVETQFFDVKLKLGEVISIEDGGMKVKDIAVVFLSPPHAKVLSRLLRERMDAYEAVFGEISDGPIGQPGTDPSE